MVSPSLILPLHLVPLSPEPILEPCPALQHSGQDIMVAIRFCRLFARLRVLSSILINNLNIMIQKPLLEAGVYEQGDYIPAPFHPLLSFAPRALPKLQLSFCDVAPVTPVKLSDTVVLYWVRQQKSGRQSFSASFCALNLQFVNGILLLLARHEMARKLCNAFRQNVHACLNGFGASSCEAAPLRVRPRSDGMDWLTT